jgi:hypothetical protein
MEDAMNRYALPLRIVVLAALVMGLALTAHAAPCSPTPMFYSGWNDGIHVTLTPRGNITHFVSPVFDPPDGGYDHIGGASSSEGYVLSYFRSAEDEQDPTNLVLAYDLGDGGQNFGAAACDCTVGLCTITRNTVDPVTHKIVLRLTQKIIFDADATDGPFKRLRVRMEVKNVSSPAVTAHAVVLRRQVDFNIDSGGTKVWANPFVNNHATTGRDGVIAWNFASGDFGPPPGYDAHGLMLRSINRGAVAEEDLTNPVPVSAKVTQDPRDTDRSPQNLASSGYVFGDAGATLEYEIGTLAPGQTKTVVVEYARF